MAKYTKDNRVELPDQTPVELPIGYKEPESLEQIIARMINAADFRKAQEASGVESFEESDDFDVEEDADFVSEHEMSQMQEEHIERFTQEPTVEQPTPEPQQGTEEDTPEEPPVKGKKRKARSQPKESESEVAST